jgi:uncharacterized membrane protein
MTLINVPPKVLIYGVENVAVDTLLATCLAALAGGSALVARRFRPTDDRAVAFAPWGMVAAAATSVYAISVLIVGLFTTNAPAIEQDAQTALAILWGVLGVAAGLLALRRSAGHLAWFAGSLAMLMLLKTALVGPTDTVTTSVLLAAQGVAFSWLLWRAKSLRDEAFAIPAFASAGLLAILTLINVPPSVMLYGVENVAVDAMLVACFALLAGGATLVARHFQQADKRAATFVPWGAAAAAGSAVYAVSVLTVGLLTSSAPGIEQDAQTALSILWGVLGVGALAYGARWHQERIRTVRIGGFILLGMAAAKVLVFDTSQLEATYRVLVFIGLGLLFLGGAFLDQQLQRPDDE